MEKRTGVKGEKSRTGKGRERGAELRLFPGAPGGGAQPLRIPRARTNLLLPGTALRLRRPGKTLRASPCSPCLPNSGVRVVVKAGNRNCAKGGKCRGTLHCELLLSCCNNGNKIKVLPNDL